MVKDVCGSSQRTKGMGTQVWYTHTAATTTDTMHLKLIKKKYIDVDLYGKTVSVPYSRWRLFTEYRADGSSEWLVGLDRHRTHDYNMRLSWERWVAIMSPDCDVEYCLGELRRVSGKSYRLHRHTNGHHWIVFGTQEGAEQTAQVFCEALGDRNIA